MNEVTELFQARERAIKIEIDAFLEVALPETKAKLTAALAAYALIEMGEETTFHNCEACGHICAEDVDEHEERNGLHYCCSDCAADDYQAYKDDVNATWAASR